MSYVKLKKHPKWPHHYLYRCLNCNWPESLYVAEKAYGTCELCGSFCSAVSYIGNCYIGSHKSDNEFCIELEVL